MLTVDTAISRFRREFNWTGTLDPTAILCVPKVLEVMGAMLPGGFQEHMPSDVAKIETTREYSRFTGSGPSATSRARNPGPAPAATAARNSKKR